MRTFLLVCMSCLPGGILLAQDTLVKRNGERIPSKVLEINPSEIKFKRSDSPDGPVYVLPPWEVSSIIYPGGRTESYEAVQPPPVRLLPAEDRSISYMGRSYYYKERKTNESGMLAIAQELHDPKVNLMIKKVQEKKLIQNAAFIGGAVLFNVGFYEFIANQPRRGRRGSPVSNAASANARQNGEYMMYGALGLAAVTITFKFDRIRHAHMVADLYNQALKR
jgi:hypothetical protein